MFEHSLLDLSRDPDQGLEQFRILIEMAFIFRPIANSMSLVEDTPFRCAQADRVLKHLEHQVSALGAVPVETQRSQRQRVRSIVCEVESALETELGPLCIREARTARVDHAVELDGSGRFHLELPDRDQVIELRDPHPTLPSTRRVALIGP